MRELLQAGTLGEEENLVLLEAGCGVGNTIFPLLRVNPRLVAYGFDFSAAAVDIAHRRHQSAEHALDERLLLHDHLRSRVPGGA